MPDILNLEDVSEVLPESNPTSLQLSDVESVEEAPQLDIAEVLPGNAPKETTFQDFQAKGDADLDKDPDFSPVQFGAKNREALLKDPAALQKLSRIYRSKETRGTTFAQKAKSVLTGLPSVVKALGAGIGTTIEKVAELNPIALGARVAGAASSNVPGAADLELKKIAGEEAEIPASVEAAAAGSGDLLRRSGRAVKEAAGKVLPGVSSKAELTEEEWRDRLLDDIAGLEQSEKAGHGSGEAMKALGLDAEKLKPIGIEVNPETVQELSVISDPINFIPFGAAVGAVSKVGGKLGTRLVATALNAEQAAKLAAGLNTARDILSAGGEVAASAAGASAQVIGKGVRTVGEAGGKAVRALGGTGGGIGLGAVLGQNIYSALGGAFVAKAGPRIVEKAGKVIQAGGEMLSGVKPTPAALRIAGDVGGEFAKGAAEGAVLAFPFFLGARPEEEEFIGGAVGVGGLARVAATQGPRAVKATGRAAQDKLAQTIFEQVEQADAPPSATYGTDPNLDTVHEATKAKLDPRSQKLLDWTRESFRDSGVEIYALDDATFTQKAGKGDAYGFALNTGERLAPDGSSTPLFQIFLNGTTDALPHELFHALRELDPTGAKELSDIVQASWTPEQKEHFSKLYNTLLNSGQPEANWTRRLGDEAIAEEAGAEVFSRLFLGQDLSGVAPTIQRKAATFLSGVLEKLGAPLGRVGAKPGEPGVSTLGIRPGAEATKRGQQWLANIADRLEKQGSLLPETRQRSETFKNLTSADITQQRLAMAPVAPAPPARPPTPRPAAPPVVPATRNIRVTRQQQNDFASRRAAETGIEIARPAADKLTPEAKQHFESISKLIEAGSPVVEIEHRGVKTDTTAAGRTSRRAEQEAAYIAEGLASAPKELRDAYQKVFVPVRWETVKGIPQLLAMSLDKVIANVHRVVKDAASKNVTAKLPYEIVEGKLTDNAWGQVVDDLKAYAENQANGYRGDGEKLVRPTEDIGVSIPAENPAYNPRRLSSERANFMNMVQGLNPPLTTRAGKGIPGNVKGQIVAELQGRTPETPAVIRPEDISKQEFKQVPGRSIKETNPLRNELAKDGVAVRELIEVTERVNVDDIISTRARPELDFKAPVTDIIRGGFLPGNEEFFTGQAFKDFFSRASRGEFGKSEVPWTPLADVSVAKDFWNEVQQHSGNFDEHIAKSIPGYRETQLRKGNAVVKAYPEGARVLDIGGSEGSWDKAISKLSDGKIETVVADPNPTMADFFRTKSEVPGANYAEAAWVRGFEDEGKQIPAFDDVKPFDVINESMVFQFISPFREEQIRAVKKHLAEDGVFLTDEKLRTPKADWKANEAKKDSEYKKVYFSKDELAAKDKVVGFQQSKSESKAVGMVDNMAKLSEYEKLLKEQFKFVAQYWDSGNFKGYAASDSLPKLQKLLREIGDTSTDFSTVETPRYLAEAEGKFLPSGKSLEQFGREVLDSSSEEWQKITEGGLTGQAYRLGLDATDRQYVETLARLRDEASTKFRAAVADGNLDQGYIDAAKAQFFSEAYGAATGGKSARNGLKTLGIDEARIPFPEFESASPKFLPKTEKGKSFIDQGFDFEVKGQPGTRSVVIKKGGDIIGEVMSAQRTPTAAEIVSATIEKPFRKKGLGEAAYRELLTQLKEDGATQVKGMMVAIEPLEIRKKIFGDFDKLEGPEGEISIDEARTFLTTPGEIGGVEGYNSIRPEKLFLPATEFADSVDPISQAAIRTAGGRVFTGSWHAEALMNLVEAASTGAYTEKLPPGMKSLSDLLEGDAPEGFIEDGYVTKSGKFLNRAQALDHAEKIKQLKEAPVTKGSFREAGLLETNEFEGLKKFLPKEPVEDLGDFLPKKKTMEQEIAETDYSKYEIQPKKSKPAKLTGWILPDQKFVGLSTSYHEQHLAENAKEYNKRFGTKLSETANVEERLGALNAGFVRVRYTPNDGAMRIEANASRFPKLKSAILRRVEDNADSIDRLYVNLLNNKGGDVDTVTVNVAELDGPERLNALKEAIDSLRGGKFLPSPEEALAVSKELAAAFPEDGRFQLVGSVSKGKVGAKDMDYAVDFGTGYIGSEFDRFMKEVAPALKKSGWEIHEESFSDYAGSPEAPESQWLLPTTSPRGDTVEFFFKGSWEEPPGGKFLPSPEFKTWFGGSQVTKEDGSPAVVYHGTKTAPTTFSEKRVGAGSTILGNYDVDRFGIFVSENPKVAEEFATQGGETEGASIQPLFLRVEAPLDMTKSGPGYSDGLFNSLEAAAEKKGLRGYYMARRLGELWNDKVWNLFDADELNNPKDWIFLFKDLGFDGIKFDEPNTSEENRTSWIAFDPDQVKSASGNAGSFSSENSDIRFLPGAETLPGLDIPTEEVAAQQRLDSRIRNSKIKFPETLPLQYRRDEQGNFIIKGDGKPAPIAVEYDLLGSPLAKEAAKGLKGPAREEAAVDALSNQLKKFYKQTEKNPEIKAGAKWYSTARTRLKKLLGDDSKFFAELLGATSARTPVEINFRFALDAYNRFKAGDYDSILAKYREGKELWDRQEIQPFLKTWKSEEPPTRGQFLDWWVEKHDLVPVQSNGKKFGANSRSVLRVLDGSRAAEVKGPKTPNFAGNLSGDTFEATIDVWAMRALHRLANEGKKARWRILPENETGVSDADFFIGQKAFRKAAEALGIKPDALQAVLWFAEKDVWEKRGWTRGAGAEKSDFNSLLAETERTNRGLRQKTPQSELNFSIEPGDITGK